MLWKFHPEGIVSITNKKHSQVSVEYLLLAYEGFSAVKSAIPSVNSFLTSDKTQFPPPLLLEPSEVWFSALTSPI